MSEISPSEYSEYFKDVKWFQPYPHDPKDMLDVFIKFNVDLIVLSKRCKTRNSQNRLWRIVVIVNFRLRFQIDLETIRFHSINYKPNDVGRL